MASDGCACFGSSFSRIVRAPSTHFHTLTVPEILHRRFFLTIKTRIALSTDAQYILPIDAHSSELRLVAPAQGRTPDEPVYETALLFVNCIGGDLRRSNNPGRAPVNRRRPS